MLTNYMLCFLTIVANTYACTNNNYEWDESTHIDAVFLGGSKLLYQLAPTGFLVIQGLF